MSRFWQNLTEQFRFENAPNLTHELYDNFNKQIYNKFCVKLSYDISETITIVMEKSLAEGFHGSKTPDIEGKWTNAVHEKIINKWKRKLIIRIVLAGKKIINLLHIEAESSPNLWCIIN